MSSFDFKKYHVRAMNAATEEEKNKINQELKDLYLSLTDDAKAKFNEELSTFLVSEYASISSLYQGVNN